MRKSQFTESQIIAVLKKSESGLLVVELCRKHGIKPEGRFLMVGRLELVDVFVN